MIMIAKFYFAFYVKNSHILAGIYLIFLKKTSETKLERLSIPKIDLTEKLGKVVIK